MYYLRWTHLPRPDRRPDALATWWATRWLPGTRWTTRFSTWPKCENLVVQSGRLEQSGRQMKLASVHIYLIGPDIWPKGSSSFQNLVAQEPSGHPLGRQSIWSPIRSPEHLVVNLVVVDAFSIRTLYVISPLQSKPGKFIFSKMHNEGQYVKPLFHSFKKQLSAAKCNTKRRSIKPCKLM